MVEKLIWLTLVLWVLFQTIMLLWLLRIFNKGVFTSAGGGHQHPGKKIEWGSHCHYLQFNLWQILRQKLKSKAWRARRNKVLLYRAFYKVFFMNSNLPRGWAKEKKEKVCK